MLRINLLESSKMSFDMTVEGTATIVNSAWLVFETKNGYDIRIPATYKEQKVSCVIPRLDGIMENGHTVVHLEVLVDNRLYRPISKEVQLGNGQQTVHIITNEEAEVSPLAKKRSRKSKPNFAKSDEALASIRENTSMPNILDKYDFGKQFDSQYQELAEQSQKKMADAKKIAAAFVESINISVAEPKFSSTTESFLKDLIPKHK